jgi:hypothetical protein
MMKTSAKASKEVLCRKGDASDAWLVKGGRLGTRWVEIWASFKDPAVKLRFTNNLSIFRGTLKSHFAVISAENPPRRKNC